MELPVPCNLHAMSGCGDRGETLNHCTPIHASRPTAIRGSDVLEQVDIGCSSLKRNLHQNLVQKEKKFTTTRCTPTHRR